MTLRRLAALVALALGVALAAASPASAHALLLRTEPAPQTTVDAPPSTVKLFFSEPVEVTFGAIRVFDVDGKRVDPGTIHRVGDGTEVDVPLTGIKDGTYTVTWRAVSADGHPVSGGFTFYVGNPSTISAVAIPSDQGAGRVVGWGFGVVRFAWFSALLGLVGAVVVRRWVWTPAVRAAGLGTSEAASQFRRRFRPVLLGAWAVLAVSGVLALVFQAATASGLRLTSAARPKVLGEVLHTNFGRLWLVQAALTVALALPIVALAAKRARWRVRPSTWVGLTLVLGAGLAADAAMNGHARTVAHPGLGEASITVHLMAVAVWVGGLAVLVGIGGPAWRALADVDRPKLLRRVLPRFSRLAVAAVAVVVASGILNAVLELSSVRDLWRLTYGRAILAKVVLLAAALALAARHRWVTPRRLAVPGGDVPATAATGAAATGAAGLGAGAIGTVAPGGTGGPGGPVGAAVGSFERTSRWEAVLLGLAVAVTAGLVVLVPGRTVALAANGPVSQTNRTGGYAVQLYIDPSAPGANEVHVSFVTPTGLAAGEVSSTVVSLVPLGAPPVGLAMRLISPGHFVGDADLSTSVRYAIQVDAGTGSTTFHFQLHSSKGAHA
jgi:copper transport protein